MKNSKYFNALQIIFGFIIIILFSWGIYELFKQLFYYLSKLKPEISAGFLVAFLTFMIPITIHFITKHYEKKAVINNELREKKIPIYIDFIKFYFSLQNPEILGDQKLTQIEITKFLNDFIQKIIIWWPDDIIKKFIDFRRIAMAQQENNDEHTIKMLFSLEELFLLIRKDLGYKNKDIIKGDISSLYINDIDKYLK